MKTPTNCIIEPLEARIAPATLDISGGGVLTYTAGAGASNTLFLSIVNVVGITKYHFSDGENIAFTGAGAGLGTGGGTSIVEVSVSAVASIAINLGDQNDTLTIANLQDPLTVNDGAGSDSVTFQTNAMTVNGALSVASETITINSAISNATTALLAGNSISINAALTTSTSVTLQPFSASADINLGAADSAGVLGLTDAELDRITTPLLNIGVVAGSIDILVSAAISPANVSTLKLISTNTITETGSITVSFLAISSTGAVTMNGANNVAFLTANVSNAGAAFAFTDATGFTIGSIAGIAGLTTNTAAGGNITLSGGDVGQSFGAPVTANGLAKTGTGSLILAIATNDISTLAVNTTGAVTYTDATGFTVGTVGTTTGITAGNGVTLTADAMTISASINAGTSPVSLKPLGSTKAIDIGGADAAGILGLSSAELNLITASPLNIGSQFTNPVTVSAAITRTTDLSIIGGSITASGAGSITAPNLALTAGTITLNGANDVDFLSLSNNPAAPFPVSFSDADGFALGTPSTSFDLAPTDFSTITLTASSGTVVFRTEERLSLSIGAAAHDQFAVTGGVTLNTQLTLNAVGTLPNATEFVLVSNDGNDAISGTFSGLAEGATIPGFTPPTTISYHGGDGNDVAIRTAPALAVTIAAGGKSATFTDVDGDFVTVKTTLGTLTAGNFSGYETGTHHEGQLQRLTLGAGFAGAGITITAKSGALGGNSFVNLGFLDATGVDLGAISIAGDIGRLDAGTGGGDGKIPGVKSLTVQSLGLLGTSTQNDNANVGVTIEGALPKLTVKGDLRTSLFLKGATDGKLGAATIGGTFTVSTNDGNTLINAAAGIGTLKIGGDIRGSAGASVGITTAGPIGTLSVGGSIVGTSATAVEISAFGQLTSPTKGVDNALKTLAVKGSVEFAFIHLGSPGGSTNADASLGSLTVGGDWLASTVLAGTTIGADFAAGTADDAKIPGATHDTAALSTIGSFIVKGQALGTAGTTSDMFGIVAERIGKAKVGGRTYAFKADAGTTLNHEAFFAAPTLDGAGTENPAFDFTIRELGAATPSIVASGPGLTLSADKKSATFTDVDGDLVTVKRTLGTFDIGDFGILTAGIGGSFSDLDFSAAPGNLTITAKPGPSGGNGLVNIGAMTGDGFDFGAVTIAGDLAAFGAGVVKSLTVRSQGLLNTGSNVALTGALPKLTIATDLRGHVSSGALLGSATLGGSLLGSLSTTAGIGTVKIAGDVRAGATIDTNDRIGAITIGGDLLGLANGDPTINASARVTSKITKGPDLALKSLTVKGGIEGAIIRLGFANNADASLGKLSVGREWLASSVQAGVESGGDFAIGTADDTKTTPAFVNFIDVATRFSTIASILIKGQSLGTPTSGDSFGIVAEQIGKAKIGTRTYAFKAPLHEAFAAGTAPFDFFLREIG